MLQPPAAAPPSASGSSDVPTSFPPPPSTPPDGPPPPGEWGKGEGDHNGPWPWPGQRPTWGQGHPPPPGEGRGKGWARPWDDRWGDRPFKRGRGRRDWDGRRWEDRAPPRPSEAELLERAIAETLEEVVAIRRQNALLKQQRDAEDAKMQEALARLHADTNLLKSSLHELQSFVLTTQTVRKASLKRFDVAYPALLAELQTLRAATGAALRQADWLERKGEIGDLIAAFQTGFETTVAESTARVEKAKADVLRETAINTQVNTQELGDLVRQLARDAAVSLRKEVSDHLQTTPATEELAAGRQRNVALLGRDLQLREEVDVKCARAELDPLQAESVAEVRAAVGEWAAQVAADQQRALRRDAESTAAELTALDGVQAKLDELADLQQLRLDIEDTQLVLAQLQRDINTPTDPAVAQDLLTKSEAVLAEAQTHRDELLKGLKQHLTIREAPLHVDRKEWRAARADRLEAQRDRLRDHEETWGLEYTASVGDDSQRALQRWADGLARELVGAIQQAQEDCLRWRAQWMQDFHEDLRSFRSDVTRANRLWGTEYMTHLEDFIDARLNRRPITRW